MCYEELKKENMRALCVWWTLLHAVPWETVPWETCGPRHNSIFNTRGGEDYLFNFIGSPKLYIPIRHDS